MRSIRPYFYRAGSAWCANCRRTRLARIRGTRYLACPHCDEQVLDRAAITKAAVVDGTLVCGRCQVNELVMPPEGVGLECPRCDTPEWDRDSVGQPAVTQLGLLDDDDPLAGCDRQMLFDRPPRPDDIVRTCVNCGQKCVQTFVWRTYGWMLTCAGCGNRATKTATKAVVGKATRRSRG